MTTKTIAFRTTLALAMGLALAPLTTAAASAETQPVSSVSASVQVAAPTAASVLPTVAPDAQPMASGCWLDANRGWLCQNVYYAPVYYGPGTDYPLVAYMISTTSEFGCRVDDGGYVGGPHPYRWVFTQGDITVGGGNGVGWMRDSDVISETNPLPLCNN